MPDSRIAVFIGSKGGSGTTTLCRELVRTLREDGNTALVDADLTGRRSIALLLDIVRSLDTARSTSPISSARCDGVTVVELAERYDAAFAVEEETVEAFVSGMTGFDTIVVDAPQPFAATVRPFISRAARFFIVLEPTLLGAAGAQQMVSDLQRFGIPSERIELVTNARSEIGMVPRSDIEGGLGNRIVAEVPLSTHRNYARSVTTLARYIQSLTPEAPLEALQPSSESPVGDRNGGSTRRRYMGGNGNGNGKAKNPALEAERDIFKRDAHEALLRQVDLVSAGLAHTDASRLAELRATVENVTAELVAQRKFHGSAEDLARLRQEIIDEALGFGPLEDLIKDPDITEIMVNGPDTIYVERHGVIEPTTKRFSDERQLRLIIERIVTPLGRRIDEASPMVDARLPDGSRVNAIIEPLAIDGAMLTIRRFGHHRLTMDDLINSASAPPEVIDLLRAAVEARLNLLVSGGTGSGKTTFLNVLSSFLPERERIVTIEDAAELLLNQPHVVRLESRPPNIEGTGEVRIRDLFRNALRMRPDRIIIGECRGPEALDMLQAMNTGHDGSLTTVHANSPRDALSRIETMVLMAGFDLPVRAIREQIASALDLVVHTSRLRDGSRKVVAVSEVVGMEGDIVTMQELVRFSQHGVDKENKVVGEFAYTGVQPNCLKRFEEYGVAYDASGLNKLALLHSIW
jgi:pilus assembly protein CpaF